MLNGTRMTLRRFGVLLQDFVDQLVTVDTDNYSPYITLSHPLQDGGVLEVYLNGQRLSVGGGVTVIDEKTIKINLGDSTDTGEPIQLNKGDEIYIRQWIKQEGYRNGASPIDEYRLSYLDSEVTGAKTYNNITYPTLKDRLEAIQIKTETAIKRVIVFVIPGRVRDGIQKPVIRFPWGGKIVDVYASCSAPPTTNTAINVEKISQDGFDQSGEWSTIFDSPPVVAAGERSTIKSQYSLLTDKVTANDHFRIIADNADGMENLTVEVAVEVRA